jgi:hypothetical protein
VWREIAEAVEYGAALAELGKEHVYRAERVQGGVGVERHGGGGVGGGGGGGRGIFGRAGGAQQQPADERTLRTLCNTERR